MPPPDDDQEYVKGRGAQYNAHNRFAAQRYVQEHIEGLDEEMQVRPTTQVFHEQPKTILNKVTSPDLPMPWSLNPYQGCEHGCIYCYARNSHEYWGYSAGMDFESKIMVKENAPALLERAFLKKTWQGEPISLSGNTDCYQPLEKDFQLTRQLLQVCLRYGNPVGIITKNQLILRDLDVLQALAAEGLVHVYLSVTTLDEKLRRVLEPRTASATARLKVIERLTAAGIPVGVMTAPIIPGLNDHEVPQLVERVAAAGALTAGYTMVRLNGAVGELFHDWLHKNFPDRAAKVWHGIQEVHGGQVNDTDYGRRMVGAGQRASSIRQLHAAARKKHLSGREMPPYNRSAFRRGGMASLF